MSARSVHVVVIAYYAERQLDRCLAALEGEFPVIVVDNSSSSGVARVSADHGCVYVDAHSNRGFAAGVNIALSMWDGNDTDVLLLNPDAVIGPADIGELSKFLKSAANYRVAAVTPRIHSVEGAEQRVAWPFPTPVRALVEAIGLGRWPARDTFMIGAVLLLRREAIQDVGRFDERFFLYAEEADWQRRARDRGWKSAVCSYATAEHEGGGTSTNESRREVLFHAAQETYVRKWFGRFGWWVYRVAVCSGAGARSLILTRDRKEEAARRMRLYLRGPRRCAAHRFG